MSAGQICSRVVATAVPDETVRTAAARMAATDVGTLVVVDPNRRRVVVGIVTDRDITVRCVALGLDPVETAISDVMSTPVQSIDENTPIEETVQMMARTNTRRLIVTNAEAGFVGIISLDDVLELFTTEAGAISRLLGRQAPHLPS